MALLGLSLLSLLAASSAYTLPSQPCVRATPRAPAPKALVPELPLTLISEVVDAAGEDLQVIYTTVKVKEQHPPPRLRGKVGMGGDLVAAMGLPKVQNLGMLDADGYRDLLTRVAVVIG